MPKHFRQFTRETRFFQDARKDVKDLPTNALDKHSGYKLSSGLNRIEARAKEQLTVAEVNVG